MGTLCRASEIVSKATAVVLATVVVQHVWVVSSAHSHVALSCLIVSVIGHAGGSGKIWWKFTFRIFSLTKYVWALISIDPSHIICKLNVSYFAFHLSYFSTLTFCSINMFQSRAIFSQKYGLLKVLMIDNLSLFSTKSMKT